MSSVHLTYLVLGLIIVSCIALMILVVGIHHEIAHWLRERRYGGLIDLTGCKRR